ncbi:hypothetical protein H112_02899 [Trichophyton rubrum D6]|uniref:Nascent polypeptide-associated complex subunit alpha-like UBA domain-containing protein n=4 Tax=Trichophyton TaxID=5550 RepID=A0A178EVQ9_TRIRU|nr:uncharacterized protein TERG_05525 [Trichophyton rubrum CBS 118892]EZF24595.1 hypothetical protein H100_02903 [Trichophyton rubrum MR850]EZF43628.1 hypothetical protein H102_02896 [Trichophyton rubrum CBS 100081]EZF54251.1 hypothetical protein H103_02910 [Trichophyton rubrum CBS 288.86]EZF64870.1 hypothetical protein H104_02889 [Trichophyton rubrum CBS 289.86]EZF75496.1 hypothetical protein H105_02916 [Trichophyton soudanense CBS 452.61]EZF86163.1 hypothetical protein H110_02911 [Trichophy
MSAKKGSETPQEDNGLSAEAGASELPTNAEDRAAAAALSSLNAPKTAAEGGEAEEDGAKKPSTADQEALGRAMSRLEMIAGGAKKGAAAAAGGDKKAKTTSTAAAVAAAAAGGEVVKKKAVKVAAEDVNLLVDQLDLTKPKATELLREHDGNAVKAIRSFITPPTAAAA